MHTGGKHKGHRSLGRPGPKWEDNIKMDFKQMGWEGIQQISLAQDRHKWHAVVNMVMNTCVPKNVENFLTENYGLSRRNLLHGVH